MAEIKDDQPKLSWLEKKLLEDKELGYDSETLKKSGKRYYKINIKDGGKVLIQDRGPHKHDYSVSLFLSPEDREVIKPKTREEYRNGARDRKWRFVRAIVASDDIDELPNFSEFIVVESFKIPETKKEILTKDSDLLKEIEQVSKEIEIDPIETGEIIEEETSQEIIIPQKIVIKPRKSTKNPINHETLLIEESDDLLELEETVNETLDDVLDEKTEMVETIPENDILKPESISTKPEVIKEVNEIDSLKVDEAIHKKLSQIEIPKQEPINNTGFRSLDEMYDDLVANSLNPEGVFNKDPQTNKYQELEWLVKYFLSKGDSNKSSQMKIVQDRYNS